MISRDLCSTSGPPIMKDEVWAAIRKMKSGIAIGLDRISVELYEALGDYGIDKNQETSGKRN